MKKMMPWLDYNFTSYNTHCDGCILYFCKDRSGNKNDTHTAAVLKKKNDCG